MMLYLCQAYSKYPSDVDWKEHEAYNQAVHWVQDLWEMGFEVFSPIMYTHPFHEFWAKPTWIDYVAHDLKMIESWLKNDYDDCILDPANNGNCEEIKIS